MYTINWFTNTGYLNPANIPTILRMPLAGFRDANGILNQQAVSGVFWSSSPQWIYNYFSSFTSISIAPANYTARAMWLSIRCLKN
jgi:hypothetical protein